MTEEQAKSEGQSWLDWVIGLVDVREFPRRKQIALGLNLVIGAVCALVFGFIARTQWGESNLNLAIDFFVAQEAASVGKTPAPADGIAFIDIDYDTHRAWGEPQQTPRDRLATLLLAAARGGASAVLLDILIEYPDHEEASNEALRAAVTEIIASYPATRIVFPVRIGWRSDRKRNMLDDLIDAHPDRLFRGVPYLSATPDDRVVRHWKLYSRFRPPTASTTQVLWGTPFLAAMLKLGQGARLASMAEVIVRRRPQDNPIFNIPVPGRGVISVSSHNTDFFLQRIRFSLIPADVLPAVPAGNLSAHTPKEVEDYARDPDLARSFFENRVVIIGNSSPDCGDIHPTPLGRMPGMYVMGNSVQTILTATQPNPTPWWLDLLIEVLALVGGAFLFVHLPGLLAQIIAWIILLALGGGLSLWYFLHNGVFLNFVFALIGMEVLGVLTEVQEALLDVFIPKEAQEDPHDSPPAA